MDCSTDSFTIVTGASQGLGRAFAEECAARGRNLILAALPGTGLPQLSSWLSRTHGVRVEAVETDLTAEGSVEELARLVEDRGFSVDMLINNAGVGFGGRFSDSTPGENEATIKLNMLAVVHLTRLLLPELRRQSRSHVLNVASLAAFFPMPWLPVYSSSKSFVLAFSLALREELRGTPVRVSVLCPNGIRTNRGVREMIDRQGMAGRLTCMYPDEAARAGIEGALRGRAVIVPRAVNRAISALSSVVPRALSMAVIARRWAPDGEAKADRLPWYRWPARLWSRVTSGARA